MRVLNSVFVFILLAAAITAQVRMRPGHYEYTFEMGAGTAKQKRLQCVAAEDVKDMTDATSIVRVFTREMEEDGSCKVSDVRTTANTLTYTATCLEDGSRMTITTTLTFSGDSITGSTTGKDYEGRPIASKLTARRVGECPK